MTSLLDDARRVFDTRRERAAATPASPAAPILSTCAVAAVIAAVLLVAGVELPHIGVVLACVAVLAAAAARRTTGSLLAGLTLWLVRPYRPGERLRLYLPAQGVAVEAEVVRIGLLNTTLVADSGVFVVANSRLLRAAPECRNR